MDFNTPVPAPELLTLPIASEVALGLYGLERVAKNIEDKTGNVTRFLVLGKEEVALSGNQLCFWIMIF
jgi:prephenate dehydratase